MSKNSRFRFKKLDNIGAADAESDKAFLNSCFVQTGELEILRDCADHRRIVLGRTGAGKTALLLQLSKLEERVISVPPESLSLSYISNSTVLTFLSKLGVKLDIFFRLLWRHIFSVELLKHHFHINSDREKKSFLEWVKTLFNKKHERAVKYLHEWGKSFWEETEYRIKELTTKLEKDLRTSVGSAIPHLKFRSEEAETLTEEQKQEVVHRAQHVVNAVQIKELSDILDLMDEVLTDPQKRYYITIDRLDEDWVDERLRLQLIRALVETARDFQKVRHAKIIVALRFDLMERVFRYTRDAGFQEEKYQSLYLPIEWAREGLVNVVDARLSYLVRQRPALHAHSNQDLLPRSVGAVAACDYIISRTLMRPRDVILFLNTCIQQASNAPAITVQMLKQAEGEYSRLRLRALADEWHSDHPNLLPFSMILKERTTSFRLAELDQAMCAEFALNFLIDHKGSEDALSVAARALVDQKQSLLDFKRVVIHALYRVGMLGLKLERYEKPTWVVVGRPDISLPEITDDCRVSIHPAFWRVFGLREL